MNKDLGALARTFSGTLDTEGFEPSVTVPPASWRGIASALSAEGVWFSDITAVDREEGVEVVAHLCASPTEQITLRTALTDGDLVLDSLVPVFPGVEWLEREVYDMFGVRFKDHPDMTRILLFEGFDGYPLRKAFPLSGEEAEAS